MSSVNFVYMKEQEPVNKQNKLTSQANSSNLERGGDIFMPDGTNGGPEQPHGPEEPRPNQEPQDSGQQDNSQEHPNSEGGSETPPSPLGSPHQESGADDNSQKRAEEEAERLKQEAVSRRITARERLGAMHPELTSEEVAEIEKQFKFNEIEEEIVSRNRMAGVERRQIGVPNSLEDLSELIMKSSAPEWGRDGERALIKKDSEGRDRVNVVNFLDWARNNMLRVHNANPLSPINFFSDIGTSVRNDVYGSQISFYEIVFTDSIFLDKTIENGKEVTKRNEDYEALRNQLLMETFLFSSVRNADITYFTNRGQGEKMMNALQESYIMNPLTRSNFLEFIFTMPSMHKKSINDLDASSDSTMRAKQEGNFYVGDAARDILSTYMNIFDYEQLKKILGEDAVLFKRHYENWDTDKAERKRDKAGQLLPDKDIEPDMEEEREGFKEKDKRHNKWFNADGSVKLGKINPITQKWIPSADGKAGVPDPDYMKYINVFLYPNPDQRQQLEVRNRIILSIKEKYGISFREAQLAELWAYSMTHVNGVAAEMDTDAVAYDWWTRLTRLKEYRKRQKADRRGAPYGGNHNLEGFKRIGLPFFEAARDIRGRSIKSIIQGGMGKNIGIENMPFKDRADYEKDKSGNIIFRRGEEVATEIAATDYEIYDEEINLEGGKKQTQTSIRFKDASGKVVEVGEAKPTKITIEAIPVRFKADLQKQFYPNHILAGAGVYKFIMDQVGLNLPELVTGYDTRGNPILDQAKLLEIKAKIEHDIRYSLSTWPEINYGDKDMRAERVEVRDEKGLVAKKKGAEIGADANGEKIYENLYLDKDWYILDEKGRRTAERNEPETFLQSREMTVLESMFGGDALRYVQFEIERHGLAKTEPQEKDLIRTKDSNSKDVTVDISEAGTDDSEFRIAVWQGAFDYLIASEIEAHRTRNSGLRYYDATDIKKASDALIEGELATPDRVKNIRKETKTTARRVYSQDFAYAFATGGVTGLLKAFQVFLIELAK